VLKAYFAKSLRYIRVPSVAEKQAAATLGNPIPTWLGGYREPFGRKMGLYQPLPNAKRPAASYICTSELPEIIFLDYSGSLGVTSSLGY